MKRSFLLTFMLLISLFWRTDGSLGYAAATTDEITYISEIALAAGNSDQNAKDQLTNNGYTVSQGVNCDLNQDAGGDYIYLGYKTTTEYSEAITDLIISIGEGATKKETINGREYEMVKCLYDFNGNLNKGAGGNYLYLKYTKKKDKGEPVITGVNVEHYWTTHGNYVAGWKNGTLITKSVDLNRGNDGNLLLLHMTKKAYTGDESLLSNRFGVENLGGGLFKFDIPVNGRDKSGVINSLGGDLTVSLRGQKIFTLQCASYYGKDCLENGDDRQIPIKVEQEKGVVIDHWTLDSLEAKDAKCYIENGDHKDRRSTTILWRASEDLLPKSSASEDSPNEGLYFSFNGLSVVNENDANKKKIEISINATTPKESMDIDVPMVMEPFINIEAGEPGWAKVMFVCSNDMLNLGLIDVTTGETRKYLLDTSTKSYELDLKAFDETHHYVAISVIKRISILSDGSQDYGYALASVPFTLKALRKLELDGNQSENASYKNFQGDSDPSAAEGSTIDGLRWIRLWKGGPRWIVEPDGGYLMIGKDEQLPPRVTDDPAHYYYHSNYCRTATRDEIEALLAHTDHNVEGNLTLTGKGDYQANKIVIQHGTSYLAAAAGMAYKNWEVFSCPSGDRLDFEKWARFAYIIAVVDDDYLPCNYLYAPTLRWKVKRPVNDDLLAEDVYQVERDFDPNFSNPDGLQPRMMADSIQGANDKDYAHYEYTDNDEARFNPKANTTPLSYFSTWNWEKISADAQKKLKDLQYPAHFTYYRVARSIVKSIWSNNNDYELKWRVLNTIVQPSITKIQLDSTDSWPKDRTVRVTVKMANPYLWEMVDPADSIDVKTEAIRQGFNHRLYQWNPKAKIRIIRYSTEDYNGKDEVEKTFIVNGSEVRMDEKNGEYTVVIDDVLSMPHTHYLYKAIIDTTGVSWPVSGPIDYMSTTSMRWTAYNDMTPVSNLEASRGTVQGRVTLTWDPIEDANRTYLIESRPYGTDTWIRRDSISDCIYNDLKADAGQVYEYRVTARSVFRGKPEKSSPVTTIGYNPYYGTIAGKVKLYNGNAMPGGNLKVLIKSTATFDIPTVKDHSGAVIMPGLSKNGFSLEIPVNENGTYRYDSIPYLPGSTKYSVNIKGLADVNFANTAGTIAANSVTLTSTEYAHTDVDFTCNDVVKLSGDILYQGSTVPVADVSFTVNGEPMRDANNRIITSDSEGHFSLLIPKRMDIKLRAVKDGHRFVNDGYLVGNASQGTSLDEGFAGKKLYDLTTVRLVGRVIGGDRQAALPLGLAMSHNNLGDSIRLVLQLEGDNTSSIVFDLQNPEKDTRDTTFTQQVVIESATVDTLTTRASFQRKRILIYANNATGEFCADLFPVKYKITSISALGYSTLTNEGEGFEVLDLSNCADMLDVSNEDYLKYMEEHNVKGDKSHRSTRYHATYQRVHHVPATVTLQQYGTAGAALSSIFGEKTIKVNNLEGVRNEITTAYMVKDTVKYAFGFPVFRDLMKYRFLATAHEDFYYNNSPEQKLEEVMLEGGHLTVYNGLENAKTKIEAELDANGQAVFVLNVDNPCFNLTDTAALRSVNAEVKVHGYYYKAKALRGFVLGEENAGTEIMPLDEKIEVMDVLRDPYGTNSYAWRDKGTEYHWDYEKKTTTTGTTSLSFNPGVGNTMYVGMGMAEKLSYNVSVNTSITIPAYKNLNGQFGEYTMTLNERVETSSDPSMQGAMADVYIGRVDVSHLRETNAFTVIDATSYRHLEYAIQSGAVKVVKEGIDAQGKECYLVVGKKLVVATDAIASTFAYSQAHILGTIIPQLQKRYNELVLHCSQEEAEQLAQSTGIARYYLVKDPTTQDSILQMAIPTPDYTGVNEAQKILNTIEQWQQEIAKNEKTKRDYVNTAESTLRTYSVSDQPIEFSEDVSAYYSDYDYEPESAGYVTWSIGLGGGGKNNSATDLYDRDSQKGAINMAGATDNRYDGQRRQEVTVTGFIWSFNIIPYSRSISSSSTNHAYIKDLRNTGFKLDLQDNGYMDIDVYKIDGHRLLGDKEWNTVTALSDHIKSFDDFKESDVETGDYVFVYRGGAMRSPWFDADSTIIYKEGGLRVPLGERPKKIDNPRIYIANPVASNIRREDKAIYSVRLTNETEYNGDPSMLKPIPLTLRLADNSNPHGAKISMDGVPLSDGRQFQLKPGETITKTIEVARGEGYDFDDLGLVFHDQTLTLRDTAKVSVHFKPESTPLTLSLPNDQWVMNTLSDRDKETGKYYLPVEITGFSTDYEGFDHIELQYKKQTEGESQWVNLCSFYNDPALYDKASGVKRMFNSTTISDFAFYGEKDIMEMRYDLRAVSFCRLGTGFVTRSSNISSGIKDTRTPEVFGKPTPANGILTSSDVISIPFNEPIAYNYLDRTANFSVRGFTNNSDINHSARLRFNGNKEYAESTVERSLKGTDFTLEMNVQVEDKSGGAKFFSIQKDHEESLDCICFMYQEDGDRLVAFINGSAYGSASLTSLGINIHNVMTHIGMIYSAKDSVLRFIAGNRIIEANLIRELNSEVTGRVGENTKQITLGGMTGYMSDVRLWQRQLNDYEVANLHSKKLSGNECDLLGWWPMVEAIGGVAADYANGADLTLHHVTWETPKGFSVKLDGKPLEIAKDGLFETKPRQDYTLGFWFKVDKLNTDGMTTLFSAGSQSLSDKGAGKIRIGFVGEKLVLQAEGNTIDFGTNNYATTGQWHYLTLVTNNLQNIASLFIDGQMVAEVSADRVGYITGSEVAFGGTGFYGYIDEVTLWHIALPQTYINDIKTCALTGKEKELSVYMSFETDQRQDDNLMKTVFTPLNQRISESTGEITGELMFDPSSVIQEENTHAPMKKDIGITNIDFSWTCSDNNLQINLLYKDAEINNQQLDLVVRGVEDLQGNPMANPLMWRVYVNKNVLIWKDKIKQIDIPYGKGDIITMPWQNTSGRVLNYTVETGAHWLTLNRTMGLANPLEESTITAKVSDGLAPGEYNAIINLIDEDGLVSKLRIEVQVEADDPDWEEPTGQDYSESMYITAIVKTDGGVIDTDERDIVAAYHNGICLGKANIQHREDNSAYVYLTVHGNENLHDQHLFFYLWDKSKGEIKRLTREKKNEQDYDFVDFRPDSIVGSHTDPLVLVYDNVCIQTIDLDQGWNWISFYVRPFIDSDVNSIFLDNTVFTTDDLFKGSLDNQGFAVFSGENVNSWSNRGANLSFKVEGVYQLYVQNPCTVQVQGFDMQDSIRVLTFNKGGWSQLPYLHKTPLPVGRAMADYTINGKAKPGTVIKGHDTFAVADADGKWYGSMDYMRPGEGYFVNHLGETCTVSFMNTDAIESEAPLASPTRASTTEQSIAAEYANAMPVIATFADDDVQQGDVLVAYCNGKEVGRAQASDLTRYVGDANRQIFFLMVNAADAAAIRFAKERDGQTIDITPRAIKFNADAIVGTLDNPFIIDFTPVTDREVYDVSGRRYADSEMLQHQRVYIVNGEKQIEK